MELVKSNPLLKTRLEATRIAQAPKLHHRFNPSPAVQLSRVITRLLPQLTPSGEPSNYFEAKSNQEWVRAMNAEIDSINKNETWKLVELPRGAKCIGLKWVFKIKRNADGTLNKYKARLVAKGYVQQPGINFDDVFAPVARIETVRLLIALAASNGWEIHHLAV
ncbi:putative mitochondrial protein AtMg00820 [Bidens hawaiensis]|uniref:putative mitochondrial protein AtMg00820 n=1 Tax=Bidens hawaiensis TaxID=980011 RepID=UPI00404B66E7